MNTVSGPATVLSCTSYLVCCSEKIRKRQCSVSAEVILIINTSSPGAIISPTSVQLTRLDLFVSRHQCAPSPLVAMLRVN